jgi:hypothetical protein
MESNINNAGVLMVLLGGLVLVPLIPHVFFVFLLGAAVAL